MAKDYRGDFCNSQNLMPKELSHSISTSAAVVGCFRPAKARAYLKPSKEEDFCLRNESWQQAEQSLHWSMLLYSVAKLM